MAGSVRIRRLWRVYCASANLVRHRSGVLVERVSQCRVFEFQGGVPGLYVAQLKLAAIEQIS
jgi:hypothetical protein